ncbi:MAG: hypothetical protein WED05_11235 [Candidatus Atabeyarchaeum deiterrae]
MLFVATHTHLASECPQTTHEGREMFKRLNSDIKTKRLGVNVMSAYISCPKSTGEDHKGIFIVEADSATTAMKFFGRVSVDVRPVRQFSEVVKAL